MDDRLITAGIKCNNKEIDRQIKEQLMHRLNDGEMLLEITRKITKCDEILTYIVKCANLGKKGSPKSPDSGDQQFTQNRKL